MACGRLPEQRPGRGKPEWAAGRPGAPTAAVEAREGPVRGPRLPGPPLVALPRPVASQCAGPGGGGGVRLCWRRRARLGPERGALGLTGDLAAPSLTAGPSSCDLAPEAPVLPTQDPRATPRATVRQLLVQLEQKVELDSRYLSAALKKYQSEQRGKGDALDKCQAELKKLRKKSQGSKNPQKYSDKELQFIDAISSKQGELEGCVSDGYKTALTEERRRFCFLVEKQCAVAKHAAAYHCKGKELLAQKLPLWQQACADPGKIPDRAVQLLQQAVGSNGALSASKSDLVISDPIPGAKPLPVPPELAPFVGVSPRPPAAAPSVGEPGKAGSKLRAHGTAALQRPLCPAANRVRQDLRSPA
ncbi:PREDICTED: brain-specific angiogenesis inhibitor 1-associated protein 2 [Condylura cristata]|uniref:brain-specific angiogenesis inhibitor 1-associated protein 2 n=1 Tax=Condylura cristata TaxID=143302 RepID=UPI000642D466|nr:PREDICTED: brain-specific angiogenesis inhibitor 1-associated protein 2 [Condylura cristata]